MKLLVCMNCHDVLRVHNEKGATCECGQSHAYYDKDDMPNVVLKGPHAHKIHIDNRDLDNALFLTPLQPARCYATFDWRTKPGWKGGTWLREGDDYSTKDF